LQTGDLSGLASETYVAGAVADEAAARGTAITSAISAEVTRANAAYATAAQGAKADTALQAADLDGKADIADLGDLAYKDMVGTAEIGDAAVTLGKIAGAAIDSDVTANSGNLITSGAVASAIPPQPEICGDSVNYHCLLASANGSWSWEIVVH
jgi:hypothetical protein